MFLGQTRYSSTEWPVIEIVVIIVCFRSDGQLRTELGLHGQPAPIRCRNYGDRTHSVSLLYGSTECG